MPKKNNMLDNGVAIELDKTRNMRFDLNTLCDLQEEYGDVIEVFQNGLQKQDFKIIRKLLHASLVGDDPELTERAVGQMITMNNMQDVLESLTKALSDSVPQEEEGKK